jgi:hypothetical protein
MADRVVAKIGLTLPPEVVAKAAAAMRAHERRTGAAREAAADVKEYERLTGDSHLEMGENVAREFPAGLELTTRALVEAARDGHRGLDVFRAAVRRSRIVGRAKTVSLRRPITATRRNGPRSHGSRRALASAGSRGDPDEPPDDDAPGNRANLVGSEKDIQEFLLEQERKGGRGRVSVTCSYCHERTRGTRKQILGAPDEGLIGWWAAHECRPSLNPATTDVYSYECESCGWRNWRQPPNGVPRWHFEDCGNCGASLGTSHSGDRSLRLIHKQQWVDLQAD